MRKGRKGRWLGENWTFHFEWEAPRPKYSEVVRRGETLKTSVTGHIHQRRGQYLWTSLLLRHWEHKRPRQGKRPFHPLLKGMENLFCHLHIHRQQINRHRQQGSSRLYISQQSQHPPSSPPSTREDLQRTKPFFPSPICSNSSSAHPNFLAFHAPCFSHF